MSAHKRDFENIREYELYLENARNHFKTIKQLTKCQLQQNNPKQITKSAPQVTTLPDAIK